MEAEEEAEERGLKRVLKRGAEERTARSPRETTISDAALGVLVSATVPTAVRMQGEGREGGKGREIKMDEKL